MTGKWVNALQRDEVLKQLAGAVIAGVDVSGMYFDDVHDTFIEYCTLRLEDGRAFRIGGVCEEQTPDGLADVLLRIDPPRART